MFLSILSSKIDKTSTIFYRNKQLKPRINDWTKVYTKKICNLVYTAHNEENISKLLYQKILHNNLYKLFIFEL